MGEHAVVLESLHERNAETETIAADTELVDPEQDFDMEITAKAVSPITVFSDDTTPPLSARAAGPPPLPSLGQSPVSTRLTGPSITSPISQATPSLASPISQPRADLGAVTVTITTGPT